MKVVTILGTRPEIIKLSKVIAELESTVNHVLVHTGQNYDYELNQIFFDDLKIKKPDFFLDSIGTTTAETIGNIISKSDVLFTELKPDAILILGDTNSGLCVIAAKRQKIPIFHMEAGNRCFDLRVPEEINRKIIDHISDVNLVYTEHARRYLLAEGVNPHLVIKTGSPMKEVLVHHQSSIDQSKILKTLNIQPKDYFLVSAHREENVDSPKRLLALIKALNAIVEKYDKPLIFSVHPRTKNRLQLLDEIKIDDRIMFNKPFGFFDYVHLQQKAFCVLSDSGTITEESSLLNFPAITIRETHERPEGMDEGVLIMSDLRTKSLFACIDTVVSQIQRGFKPNQVSDYNDGNVGFKVVRIILSYTSYVNQNVWRKTEA